MSDHHGSTPQVDTSFSSVTPHRQALNSSMIDDSQVERPMDSAPRKRHRACFFPLLAGMLVTIYFVHYWPNFVSANEYIRFYAVMAVVEHHTFSLDEVLNRFGENVDRAYYQGHSYMDKAPGISVLILPWYLLWLLIAGPPADNGLVPFMYLVTILICALPALAAAMALQSLLRKWRGETVPSTALYALGYLVATPALIYDSLLFDHGPATAFIFLSFYFLHRRTFPSGPRLPDPKGARDLVCAGLLTGLAAFCEYTAVSLAPFLFLYALASAPSGRRIRQGLVFLACLAPWIILLLGYNWLLFDSPFHFPYFYKADRNLMLIHSKGLLGFQVPSLINVLRLYFSPQRGLFFLSPWLILAVPGAVAIVRHSQLRREAVFLVLLIMGYSALISGFVDWRAGSSVGPRHLLPVVPFLVLLAGMSGELLTVLRLPRFLYDIFLALILGLTVVSFGQVFAAQATFPWFLGSLENPIYQQAIPLLLDGFCARSLGTILGLAPWPAIGLLLFLSLSLLLYWWLACFRGRVREVSSASSLSWRFNAYFLLLTLIISIAIFVLYIQFSKMPDEHSLRVRLEIVSLMGFSGRQ